MNIMGIKLMLEGLGSIDAAMPREVSNTIQNLPQFHQLVENSKSLPGAVAIISKIEKHQIYASNAPNGPVNEAVRAFIRDVTSFREYLRFLEAFVAAIGTTQSSEFDILAVFQKTGDLPALTEQLDTFQKILEQTILGPPLNGRMEIRSVENGSFIIQLFLGSLSAVTCIAGVAWSAAVIYKKCQEAFLVKAHVEGLEIRNEALNEIKVAQAKMLNSLVTAEARHLEKEIYGGEEDPERLERIKHSIELMQGLLEKGAEVHPALMAPEQVKNLFPDYKKLGSIESKIKQLADKLSS